MNIAFFFEPKSDITVYELAVCMPYAARTVRPEAHNIEKMDQETRRHFRCVYDQRDDEAELWVIKYLSCKCRPAEMHGEAEHKPECRFA